MRSSPWFLPLFCAVASACSNGSGGDQSTSQAAASDVVVNEMSASGDEWLELYNSSSRDFDLSHYGVTDTDKTTGSPRLDKAARFPAGTKITGKGFTLVLLGKKNSTPGPYSSDACLAGVDVGCFYADFSISEARGEAVHLLSPDDTAVVDTFYPANLAFDAGSNLTACRIPDGTGDLVACDATPGAKNRAH
ncbi:MAG TPA: lamin tail domain-containing protein [Polyangiaceae bacterium]|nr:lamin tail domain-containing protein [Polyangiaceae bacterium]